MIHGAIQILIADSTVKALIGKNKADDKWKVYPAICPIPENSPYLILRRTGKAPVQCKGALPTMIPYDFEVIAYHKSYDKLDDIENAVTQALDGKTGVHGGVSFKNLYMVNAFDADYVPQYELYTRVIQFKAMVNAVTPT